MPPKRTIRTATVFAETPQPSLKRARITNAVLQEQIKQSQ
jgi:hypothetical protein